MYSFCNHTNRTPATRSSNFVNHSYDYRPNWTPLISPVTITNTVLYRCCFFQKTVACVADIIQSRLVTSAKQRQDSLFWVPNGLNELLQVRFKFPFILTGKFTIAFFNGPIMARTQIPIHRWRPRTRSRHCFADRPYQNLVSSVAQANKTLSNLKRGKSLVSLVSRCLSNISLVYPPFSGAVRKEEAVNILE